MDLFTVPSITWQGEQKPTSDPDELLCTFDTIVDGIRAGAINLLSYYLHDGCNTIETIISRYAPPGQNNTTNYIAFIASYCCVPATTPVTLTDKAFLTRLVAGIIDFEMGGSVCSPSDIAQGVEEALAHSSPNLSYS